MKKLFVMLLALALLVCLAACGAKEKEGEKAPESTAAKTPDEITGEIYNAGNVSVLVPTGWKAFPVADMWSDEENATDPDQVSVVKGGSTEFDLLTKPYIQVVHYEPGSMMTPSKELYDGAEDLAPITSGALTWEGFSAKGLLGDDMIIMWTTNADGHQFQLNIFNKTDAGEFAMTDADVLAILGSIKNS